MKKLFTFCGLFALGLSSAASAQNLLTNPGAEDGDLTGWTVDLGSPSASVVCGYGGTIDTGTYSFSMDQCDTTDGTLVDTFWYAQVSQEVDTTGCNVVTNVGELTGGTYSFSTRYQDRGDDQASYGLTFFDAFHAPLETTDVLKASEADILFHDGVLSGAIPAGATDIEVRIGGKGVPEVDSHPGAYHDNVVYEFTSCVAAYAVTAGKTTCTGGNESEGGGDGNETFIPISDCDGANGTPSFAPGNSGVFVHFEGAIFVEAQLGLMDGTGTGAPESFPYTGTPSPGSFISFKSKQPKRGAYCTLTPGAGATVTITETDWSINTLWDHYCEDRHGHVIDASIWNIPTGAFNALGGTGRDQDRGMFYLSTLEFPLARGWSETNEN